MALIDVESFLQSVVLPVMDRGISNVTNITMIQHNYLFVQLYQYVLYQEQMREMERLTTANVYRACLHTHNLIWKTAK